MGIYEILYEDFGCLIYEMWCVVCLVIDIGVYSKGWSCEQVLVYLCDYIVLSEYEVIIEVDCYIFWLGQVLSYKLGEIVIVCLCVQVEKELGDKFDIKGFYDILFKQGLVLLLVLEQQIQVYIVECKKV